MHIASNGSADSHRFCTLQVCIRNMKDESLPRHGQPRLCICFRGTGARISDEETQQYHPDVIVMWQPKAWYDNATCNKRVAMYALKVPCPHMPNLNNPNPNPNPNPRR